MGELARLEKAKTEPAQIIEQVFLLSPILQLFFIFLVYCNENEISESQIIRKIVIRKEQNG